YGGAFILPILAGEGTFFDGLIYAVLSNNYAEGLGTLWNPHFSTTIHPTWHEHPPAGLWLMSLFYRALGDGPLVEHVYSLFTAVVSGGLLVLVWRELVRREPELRSLGWLPLLFWLMNPQVTWSYSNAMLENTMTIFVLAAFWLLLKGLEAGARFWAWSLAAGVAVVAAVLTKGPVGFFPLVSVGLARLVWGRTTWSRVVVMSALMTAVVALAGWLLWAWPEAHQGLGKYVNTQLLLSLKGSRGGSPDWPGFLEDILNTHLPALGVTVILLGVGWRRRMLGLIRRENRRLALFLILLGCAGSLPVGLSPRHSLFYLLPSFPFYALGLAALVAPVAAALIREMRPAGRIHRILQVLTVVLLAAVLVVSATRIGGYSRDEQQIRDLKVMRDYLVELGGENGARGVVIGSCADMRRHFTLMTQFARYGGMAFTNKAEGFRYLVALETCEEPDLDQFTRVAPGTKQYHLYERR
ncbi:hypothetical protein DRQ50_08415, partial [bacterium]